MIVGTAGSFNWFTFMKKIIHFAFTLILFSIVTNCGVTKDKNSVGKITKPEFSNDDEVYVPILKSDRKNFFKDSDPETKWVDSICLLYTSPSPRDYAASRMPSSA